MCHRMYHQNSSASWGSAAECPLMVVSGVTQNVNVGLLRDGTTDVQFSSKRNALKSADTVRHRGGNRAAVKDSHAPPHGDNMPNMNRRKLLQEFLLESMPSLEQQSQFPHYRLNSANRGSVKATEKTSSYPPLHPSKDHRHHPHSGQVPPLHEPRRHVSTSARFTRSHPMMDQDSLKGAPNQSYVSATHLRIRSEGGQRRHSSRLMSGRSRPSPTIANTHPSEIVSAGVHLDMVKAQRAQLRTFTSPTQGVGVSAPESRAAASQHHSALNSARHAYSVSSEELFAGIVGDMSSGVAGMAHFADGCKESDMFRDTLMRAWSPTHMARGTPRRRSLGDAERLQGDHAQCRSPRAATHLGTRHSPALDSKELKESRSARKSESEPCADHSASGGSMTQREHNTRPTEAHQLGDTAQNSEQAPLPSAAPSSSPQNSRPASAREPARGDTHLQRPRASANPQPATTTKSDMHPQRQAVATPEVASVSTFQSNVPAPTSRHGNHGGGVPESRTKPSKAVTTGISDSHSGGSARRQLQEAKLNAVFMAPFCSWTDDPSWNADPEEDEARSLELHSIADTDCRELQNSHPGDHVPHMYGDLLDSGPLPGTPGKHGARGDEWHRLQLLHADSRSDLGSDSASSSDDDEWLP